jgi:hypothetical protein
MTATVTVGKLPSEKAMIKALGGLDKWSHRCHEASLTLIRSGVFGRLRARVARGFADGVSSQHSWVVMGMNCYDRTATIIDPTLWSYDSNVEGIWTGSLEDEVHRPHGMGSIWDYGKPRPATGTLIKLTPKKKLSDTAKDFLKMVGPQDRMGWQVLANSPVEGWPAGEILAAMDDTVLLTALVPIDKLGMLTDRNPGHYYW